MEQSDLDYLNRRMGCTNHKEGQAVNSQAGIGAVLLASLALLNAVWGDDVFQDKKKVSIVQPKISAPSTIHNVTAIPEIQSVSREAMQLAALKPKSD